MIGAQAQRIRFQRGFDQAHAGRLQILGEFDDQNRILCGKTDSRQQTDLKVHVVGKPAHAGGENCADHAERYDEHDRERN